MDNQDFEPIAIEALTPEFLGLDPSAIASMAQLPPVAAGERSAVADGLNRFMRKALAGYLALADVDRVAVRLKDEASARANGWPDARTANVAMTLIWALLVEDREIKGLSPVPLLASDPAHAALDPVIDGADTLSGYELCRAAMPPLVYADEMRERRARGIAAPADGPAVASTNAAVSDILGLDPAALEAIFQARTSGERPHVDSETRVRLALNFVVRGALRQFYTMRDRRVDEIRLLTEQDARDAGKADARTANLATLLSAALLFEDSWQVVFYPPRQHGPDYQALLRQVAAFAMRDGSRQAAAALEALVERDVHFGPTGGPRKHNRLLQEAFQELKGRAAD